MEWLFDWLIPIAGVVVMLIAAAHYRWVVCAARKKIALSMYDDAEQGKTVKAYQPQETRITEAKGDQHGTSHG